MSILLILNGFDTLFGFFHCWLWASNVAWENSVVRMCFVQQTDRFSAYTIGVFRILSTSKKERFAEMVNVIYALLIFAKCFVLGVWQGFEYASIYRKISATENGAPCKWSNPLKKSTIEAVHSCRSFSYFFNRTAKRSLSLHVLPYQIILDLY